MDNLNHITAEWARQQSQSIETAKAQKQLYEVLDKISIAVKSNEYSICFSNYLMDVTKKELEKRGFKVTFNQEYSNVSW